MADKKPRPKTGEPRKTRQPLHIDRLPSSVHAAIKHLYVDAGKTWLEIERLSSEPYNGGKGPGFIDWDNLPIAVLELFPNLRLSDSTLQRWFDLRVAQVTRDVMARSAQARAIAQGFAKSVVDKDDEAVVNAARDIFMGILSSDGSEGGRMAAAKGLTKLSEVMSKAKANDIRERKVSVEERRIAQLEKDAELKRKRLEAETESVVKKMSKGELTIDDINRLRRNTFGLPPLDSNAVAAGAAS